MAWARASLSKAKTKRRVDQTIVQKGPAFRRGGFCDSLTALSRVVRSEAIDHTNAHSKQETLRSEDERKKRFRYADPGFEDRSCLREVACACRRAGRGSGVSRAASQPEKHSVGAGFS